MIDNLKRIREPLTWAVIAIVAANLVLGIVRLTLALQQEVPVFTAFQEIGSSLMNLTLVVVVVALVCTCFFISPATRHALLVTRVAAWVLTIGVLISLVCSMLGVAASANTLGVVFEVVGSLLDLILKGLAAGALWVLMRGVDAGRIDTAVVVVAEAGEPVPAIEVTPTVWQRSEATGTAWRTADEAASGAPGSVSLQSDRSGGDAIFRDEVDEQSPKSPRG